MSKPAPSKTNVMFALGLCSAAAWLAAAAYFAMTEGLLDGTGHAMGRDFVNNWTAARLASEGRIHEVFDPFQFYAAVHAMVDPTLLFHFWPYPPTYLAIVQPLGRLPYIPAFIVWSVASLGLLAVAARAVFPARSDVVFLLASPAVATNLVLGQNGGLTAALLLAAVAMIDRRPRTAGVLLGLLTFKPQLGLLAPVLVVAERRWSILVAAALTGAAFAGFSAVLFGVEAWRDFATLTVPMQTTMMQTGKGPFMLMMVSAFASGRVLGLDATWAMALQAPFTLAAGVLAWRACRGSGPVWAKVATMMVTTLLATPQALNYDMIPVAAAALLLAHRAQGWPDRALCVALWFAPILVIALNGMGAPITPLILAAAAFRLDREHTASARLAPAALAA